MTNNNEIRAKISNKISKSFWILLAVYVVAVVLFIALGFGDGWYIPYVSSTGSVNATLEKCWYGLVLAIQTIYQESIFGPKTILSTENNAGSIILLIFIILIFISLPLIYLIISNRKRKLTELSITGKEAVGSYTAFIPVSKITLRMPIEKIDNISAIKSFFFIFTGKGIKISSTSGTIRIPYVLNADEIVAFISETIEETRKEQIKPVTQNNEAAQSDYANSIKKLAELRDSGIITEDEFNQKKAELLEKI